MIIELVSTGTELLLGQITNLNAPYLAGQLNAVGFNVLYQSTVGDNRERMSEVFKIALSRADIVITSGGLGPTLGDITKETVANLLNQELKLHEPSLERLKEYLVKHGFQMSDNNLRQVMIPEGAIVLKNSCGTAPGVVSEAAGGKTFILLPGPPHELKAMVEESVLPYLQKRFAKQGVIVSKVLRSFGLGESMLEEKIREQILNQSNPTIALLVKSGEVHIRLTAKAASASKAQELIAKVENEIRPILKDYIFGADEESLPEAIGKLLAKKKLTVAVAESCTGGLTSSMITDIPGSSDYFNGGLVCYSNDLKSKIAGVPAEIISAHGAVSQPVAVCLAEGIRKAFAADIGVGITGIAGPGGGSQEKPVGLVYIAISSSIRTDCSEHRFTGNRIANKQRMALTALNCLRKHLIDNMIQ